MRRALVEARTQLINTVRGWLRTQINGVRCGGPRTFPKRVREKLLAEPTGMPAFVERQLCVIDEINVQIKEADAEVARLADRDPVCQRLMSVPGVGPITSTLFVATIDDVSRFPNAPTIESYLGLTPGERSSSLKTRRTGITKAGSAEMRRVLTQACWVIWTTRPQDPLALWGRQVAERRGKQIAIVAMCRKLVGIMYAIWRDETAYDPTKVSRLVSGSWRLAA
jgi:transposase